MSLESIRQTFNVRKDKRPAYEANMTRIRRHYPYSEEGASKSWIVLDALGAFADLLDANAAALAEEQEVDV